MGQKTPQCPSYARIALLRWLVFLIINPKLGSVSIFSLSFLQRSGVYAEKSFGQGSGVYAERAGVYAEDREFMMKIGSLCTKAVYRVRFPD